MSERAHRHWTVEEFFAWQDRQSERYELVGGTPLRMMVGARTVHNDIVINILAALHSQLRGAACRPFNGDSSVETLPGQIRRPDAGVDCGKNDPNGLKAVSPRLVVEVLSPGTRDIDLFVKLEEYKRIESLLYILYVDPNEPDAVLWSREEGGDWGQRRFSLLEEAIAMPSIPVELAMADVYERVVFPPRPVL